MEIIYGLQKLGRFFVRLIKWLPVIWKQEDWDFMLVYDLLAFRMKEVQRCLARDKLHMGMEREVRKISICLAYLDRWRNWPDYITAPPLKWTETEDGLYRLTSTKSEDRIYRQIWAYEKFNYDMFWKRFLQWHKGWWC